MNCTLSGACDEILQVAAALKQNNEELRTFAPLFAAPVVLIGLLFFATARYEWRLKHNG